MTTMHQLQLWLRDTNRYHGEIDGDYGRETRGACLAAMEDGPDTLLTDQDYRSSAARLGVKESAVRAFAEVEANGAGFFDGKPKILFEPHVFARLTQHRFNDSNPTVSYSSWGLRPYPPTQDGRYAQLLEAIGLDPWAAFQAASYGKFQILGENFGRCGYDSPWAFAASQAYDELSQLKAFEMYLQRTGIAVLLRASMWAEAAKRYNGPAYARNKYDVKLAMASRAWAQKLGEL
jgi:hypothetical protein